MIAPAQKYQAVLKEKLIDTWYNPRYKYYRANVYANYDDLPVDTWKSHDFVSLDKDNNVLGYISYSIDRTTCSAYNLAILSFVEGTVTFGKDLIQVINDIFYKYNFYCLTFSVVVGNPIEKTYDKLIAKYGGNIVGTYKSYVRLDDGSLYDLKLYQILKTDIKAIIANREISIL